MKRDKFISSLFLHLSMRVIRPSVQTILLFSFASGYLVFWESLKTFFFNTLRYQGNKEPILHAIS